MVKNAGSKIKCGRLMKNIKLPAYNCTQSSYAAKFLLIFFAPVNSPFEFMMEKLKEFFNCNCDVIVWHLCVYIHISLLILYHDLYCTYKYALYSLDCTSLYKLFESAVKCRF